METKVDKIAYQTYKASGKLERYRGQLIANELNYRGYDINYQIAIGFDKEEKPEEYAAYQAVRAEVKEYIDVLFEQMERSIHILEEDK